jgi:putative ABC transport system permease protein
MMARGQALVVTRMNLRNLPARWGAALVAVIGIAGVVTVLVGTLAMSQGFRAALDFAGSESVAVIVRSGSDAELSSALNGDEVQAIVAAPGIATAGGRAIVSPEVYVLVDLPMRSTGTAANVPFRGVGPNAGAVRDRFRIVEGRMFTPGLNEVIAGRGAAAQFVGVRVGDTVRFGSIDWQVVGRFEDGGSVSESEVWGDVHVLQGVYQRGNSYQSVRARLARAGDVRTVAAALRADPRVNVAVSTESAFYAEQSQVMVKLVTTVGTVIAVLMGVGAVFGAVNTMYSAVAARTREIATLRALGFGSTPIVVSVLVEAVVLGVAGGVLGSALAHLAFNGVQASTLNFQTFSQLTFAFAVTPGVLLTGVAYAVALGLVGGLLPALRAATMPVTAGLRAS